MASEPLRLSTPGDTLALGRLGAVLALRGRPGPVGLGPNGPFVVTSNADSRRVLGDTEAFAFPVDVSRRAATGPQPPLPRLRPDQVATGLATLEAELPAATARWDAGETDDAMQVLRAPVARSTTGAVLGPLDPAQRDGTADLVLAWIDALAPVIAADRPPHRWSGVRRAERRTRTALEAALTDLRVESPATIAVGVARIRALGQATTSIAIALLKAVSGSLRRAKNSTTPTSISTVGVYQTAY